MVVKVYVRYADKKIGFNPFYFNVRGRESWSFNFRKFKFEKKLSAEILMHKYESSRSNTYLQFYITGGKDPGYTDLIHAINNHLKNYFNDCLFLKYLFDEVQKQDESTKNNDYTNVASFLFILHNYYLSKKNESSIH